MKILVLAAALLATGCCANVHAEVAELRKIHAAYRSGVEAKKIGSDGQPIDPAKVDLLGQKIDQSLAKIEELTK